MKPRFLPILLTLCPVVFNQSAASAYDQNAQQQIQQIQQQLEQQFPQQIQSNQPRSLNQGMIQQYNQGTSQSPDAQQQIMQINQQLQQMTQAQQFQQQPVRPQMQQTQQMPQAQLQARQPQPILQSQNAGFAPSNTQSLNLPVLNSTISGYTSVNDVVPNAVGATSGVDILDESLKFHSQVNGQQASLRPMPLNTNQNFNVGVASNHTCNHATVSSVNNGPSCCPHSHNNSTSGSTGDSLANGGGQISTRAIGALGAAALVGTFLGNGGVGGVIKSVGWDNSRHTRGMSIGGY